MMKSDSIRSAEFSLRLLGPIEVTVGGEPVKKLRSQKVLWALALLAIRANRPVQRDWLACTLWPDSDRETALANLRPVLSDLRGALDTEGCRLQSPARDTLVLDLHDSQLDLVDFEAAVDSFDRGHLEFAVQLYRGPLLEGCCEEWVHQERAIREQQMLLALQRLAEVVLAAGDPGKAVALYRRAISIDPWRDSARRGLMDALARSGDLNSAIHTYREFAAFIQADGRATPDEATTALYTRLRLESRRLSASPPRPPLDSTENNSSGSVPFPLTPIVGRDDEREEVGLLLRRSRLVTLTGAGGIGKTRLAMEIAAEIRSDYPDGVWFVPFESIGDGRQVANRVASVLQLRDMMGGGALECVVDRLRKQRLVLILDNCEHLLDDSAELVSSLLRECRDVRILVTSREPLGITGETVWQVPALETPVLGHLPKGTATMLRVLLGYDSVQLFVQRSQAARTGFALNESNARAVAEICILLEGIPLAIEFVAAWVKSRPVETIVAQLKADLDLLDTRHRGGSARHLTIRSTIDWSYGLLDDRECLLLQRLSVFRGGWCLEAAESICSGQGIGPGEIASTLGSLVDKSLVNFGKVEPGSEDRYWVLNTVRLFAQDKLPSDAEVNRLTARHRRWFVAFAEVAEQEFYGEAQRFWLGRLKSEQDNLLRAMEFADSEAVGEDRLRLSAAIAPYFCVIREHNQALSCLQRAVEWSRTGSPTVYQAKALCRLGTILREHCDFSKAKALLEEALDISNALGEAKVSAQSMIRLADIEETLGNTSRSAHLLDKSLSLNRQIGDWHGVSDVLSRFGNIAITRGEFETAKRYYLEAECFQRKTANSRGVAGSLYYQGNVAICQGEYDCAADFYERSLSIAVELDIRRGIALATFKSGEVLIHRGDPLAAQRPVEDALVMFVELADPQGVGWSNHSLGDIAFDLGDVDQALRRYDEALQVFGELGDRRAIAVTTLAKGIAMCSTGELIAARNLLQSSLEVLDELGDTGRGVECIEELASLLSAEGLVESCATLLGFATKFREGRGAPVATRRAETRRRDLSTARAALGDRFEAVWRDGGEFTWRRAVEYSLAQAAQLR